MGGGNGKESISRRLQISRPISPRPVILVILKDGVGPWVLICLFVCKSGFSEDEDWYGGEKKWTQSIASEQSIHENWTFLI